MEHVALVSQLSSLHAGVSVGPAVVVVLVVVSVVVVSGGSSEVEKGLSVVEVAVGVLSVCALKTGVRDWGMLQVSVDINNAINDNQ